jgi:hypothetical protein
MENDIKALIEKLKDALKYQFKVELSVSMFMTETGASALVGADSRVQNAEATLMALVKAATRKV